MKTEKEIREKIKFIEEDIEKNKTSKNRMWGDRLRHELNTLKWVLNELPTE